LSVKVMDLLSNITNFLSPRRASAKSNQNTSSGDASKDGEAGKIKYPSIESIPVESAVSRKGSALRTANKRKNLSDEENQIEREKTRPGIQILRADKKANEDDIEAAQIIPDEATLRLMKKRQDDIARKAKKRSNFSEKEKEEYREKTRIAMQKSRAKKKAKVSLQLYDCKILRITN
jgi:hypothetical protein